MASFVDELTKISTMKKTKGEGPKPLAKSLYLTSAAMSGAGSALGLEDLVRDMRGKASKSRHRWALPLAATAMIPGLSAIALDRKRLDRNANKRKLVKTSMTKEARNRRFMLLRWGC